MKGKSRPILFLVTVSMALMSVTVFLNVKIYQNDTKAVSAMVKVEEKKTGNEKGNEQSRSLLAFSEEALNSTKNMVAADLLGDSDTETTANNVVAGVAANTQNINIPIAVLREEPIVFDGLTQRELADKLNRTLHSNLAGYGELIATYALQVGVDPYMAVAIILHETGCSSSCSSLVRMCNNVGGQKGAPGCGGGAYKSFATLEEGIRGFLDNLAKNYIAYGLTTPDLIGPKYAESTTWVSKIYSYINTIKAA